MSESGLMWRLTIVAVQLFVAFSALAGVLSAVIGNWVGAVVAFVPAVLYFVQALARGYLQGQSTPETTGGK